MSALSFAMLQTPDVNPEEFYNIISVCFRNSPAVIFNEIISSKSDSSGIGSLGSSPNSVAYVMPEQWSYIENHQVPTQWTYTPHVNYNGYSNYKTWTMGENYASWPATATYTPPRNFVSRNMGPFRTYTPQKNSDKKNGNGMVKRPTTVRRNECKTEEPSVQYKISDILNLEKNIRPHSWQLVSPMYKPDVALMMALENPKPKTPSDDKDGNSSNKDDDKDDKKKVPSVPLPNATCEDCGFHYNHYIGFKDEPETTFGDFIRSSTEDS